MADPIDQQRSPGRRDLARGERTLPGVFRLRLPLPWPGIPHCNAWAVRAGDGLVLFDTGLHQAGSIEHLEQALGMCGLALEQVRLVVCTHAHSDHYGQVATVVGRTGAELWMHPNYSHMSRLVENPQATLESRLEIARQSGVPEAVIRSYAAREDFADTGIAGFVPPDRELVDGVLVETDLGPWRVYETPGHAPSHVSLLQAERRLMISGDHLLGRVAPFFEYGYSPDPVGEFVRSLDLVSELDVRLCLPGHGRTFTDVMAHIEANRETLERRLARIAGLLGEREMTVFELMPPLFGDLLQQGIAPALFLQALAMLTHLERSGRVRRLEGEPERWIATNLDTSVLGFADADR